MIGGYSFNGDKGEIELAVLVKVNIKMLSRGDVSGIKFVPMMSESSSDGCGCLSDILCLTDVTLYDVNKVSGVRGKSVMYIMFLFCTVANEGIFVIKNLTGVTVILETRCDEFGDLIIS